MNNFMLNFDKFDILASSRLYYRLFKDTDKAQLRHILSDTSVTEPAGYKAFSSDEEFDHFFELLKKYSGIAIILNNNVIGYVRIYPETMDCEPYIDKKCAGIAFVLGKEYHHQGYGTEMLTFFTAKIKEHFDYCIADAFIDNAASNALIKKCGYKYVEDYTEMFDALGKEMVCHSYIY